MKRFSFLPAEKYSVVGGAAKRLRWPLQIANKNFQLSRATTFFKVDINLQIQKFYASRGRRSQGDSAGRFRLRIKIFSVAEQQCFVLPEKRRPLAVCEKEIFKLQLSVSYQHKTYAVFPAAPNLPEGTIPPLSKKANSFFGHFPQGKLSNQSNHLNIQSKNRNHRATAVTLRTADEK
ncbi:MAG: hypothetical protein IJ262_09585 [Clostridia bacterium]|nr:hypothetical protein [Clostridia bacterium]